MGLAGGLATNGLLQGGGGGGGTASGVSFDPTGLVVVTTTNVQAAITELDGRLGAQPSWSNLAGGIAGQVLTRQSNGTYAPGSPAATALFNPTGPGGTLLGNAGTAQTLTLADQPLFYDATLSAASCTMTINQGRAAGRWCVITVTQDATGGRALVLSDGTTTKSVTLDTTATTGVTSVIVIDNGTDLVAFTGPRGATGATGSSLSNTAKRDITMPFRATGVLSRTADPQLSGGSINLASGVARFAGGMVALSGDAISNLEFISAGTAGSGLTAVQALLCDSAGVVLAKSINYATTMGNAWAANTTQDIPITIDGTNPYTPGSDLNVAPVIIVIQSAGAMPNVVSMSAASPTAPTFTAGRPGGLWGGAGTATFTTGTLPNVGDTIAKSATISTPLFAQAK